MQLYLRDVELETIIIFFFLNHVENSLEKSKANWNLFFDIVRSITLAHRYSEFRAVFTVQNYYQTILSGCCGAFLTRVL